MNWESLAVIREDGESGDWDLGFAVAAAAAVVEEVVDLSYCISKEQPPFGHLTNITHPHQHFLSCTSQYFMYAFLSLFFFCSTS